MTTLPVIVYGNGDLFRECFNAIVTAFGKGEGASQFRQLLHIATILAGLTVISSFILRRDLMVMVKWLGIFYAAVYVLFIPDATIIITDRVNHNAKYVVDHVPLGLATIASYTSTIGDALTQNIEARFTMPDDLRYHRSGMVFASRLVEAASQFEITDAEFDQNLEEFVHQCIFYDLLLGKYSINTLLSAPYVWEQVTMHASPARAFVYHGNVTTCSEGARALTEDWKKQINEAAAQYGKRIYPTLAQDKAKAKLMQDLPLSYHYLSQLSESANHILQQNLLANAIQRGVLSMGAKLNAPAALEAYSFARAQEQKRLTNQTLGEMAAHWLPLMKNAFEVIMYGSFIFIVLLSVFPFGTTIIKNYVFTLLWIQIWAPLYAMINLIVSYYAQIHTTAAANGLLSLQGISGILQINADISGLAGYLTLSVPFLSAGLVRGMAATFTQLSQYVGGVTQSTAGIAAAEGVTGNLSFGNTSLGNQNMHNFSSNHFDTSGRFSAGSFTTALAGGSTMTVTSDGSTVIDMKNALSNLGTSINFSDALRSSYSNQAERSITAAESNAVALNDTISSSIKNMHELNRHLNHSHASGEGWSISTSSGIATAVARVDKMTQDFADRHHISYNESANLLASAHVAGQLSAGFSSRGIPAGKILSALGLEASATGSAGVSRTAGHNNSTDKGALFSEAESYIKDHHYAETVDMVERAVKEQSIRTSDEKGSRLLDSLGASLDRSHAYRNELNSNLSKAESAREMASMAFEKSENINANANQHFMEWLANQPGTDGRGKLGLRAIETIQKDPGMQLYYANQYMEQYKHQFEANWHHGLAHTQDAIKAHASANNKEMINHSTVAANYQSNKTRIENKATNQGLTPHHIDVMTKNSAELQISTNQNRINHERNEIMRDANHESAKITTEETKHRHGSLAEDLLHDIDTKS